VIAPEFVRIVLGPQWVGAITIVQILAFVGLVQSLQSLNSIVLQARDRTGDLLRWSLLSLGVDTIAVLIGLQWGAVGVAAALAVGTALIAPVYLYLTTRSIELGTWKPVWALAGVLEASAAMAVATWVARQALIAAGTGTTLRFVLLLPFAALLQLLFLWLLARSTVLDAWGLAEPLLRSWRQSFRARAHPAHMDASAAE
jgi:PST family polysaccharide transporter